MAEAHSHHAVVEKIVSGGQTGVDRGALDAAIELGLAHGGWCPKGRLAENGLIPDRYRLSETDSAEYVIRTERNVLDSDATLVLCRGPLRGGTRQTVELAVRHGKPNLVVRLDEGPSPQRVFRWLGEHDVRTLNVAGPRESNAPGIEAQAAALLRAILESPRRVC